jgi:hypothetical protein
MSCETLEVTAMGDVSLSLPRPIKSTLGTCICICTQTKICIGLETIFPGFLFKTVTHSFRMCGYEGDNIDRDDPAVQTMSWLNPERLLVAHSLKGELLIVEISRGVPRDPARPTPLLSGLLTPEDVPIQCIHTLAIAV